jgi:hypothetical protein
MPVHSTTSRAATAIMAPKAAEKKQKAQKTPWGLVHEKVDSSSWSLVPYDTVNAASHMSPDAGIDGAPSQPVVAKQPFRFLDLPAELRNNVYRQLILNGHTLQFRWVERPVERRAQWVNLVPCPRYGARGPPPIEPRWVVDSIFRNGVVVEQCRVIKFRCSSVLLVNKFISNEAKGRPNTYSLLSAPYTS